MITDRLLLYRNLTAEDEDLLFDTLYLHEHYLDEATPSKDKQARFSRCVSRLLSMGETSLASTSMLVTWWWNAARLSIRW